MIKMLYLGGSVLLLIVAMSSFYHQDQEYRNFYKEVNYRYDHLQENWIQGSSIQGSYGLYYLGSELKVMLIGYDTEDVSFTYDGHSYDRELLHSLIGKLEEAQVYELSINENQVFGITLIGGDT